mmetsp:Transcript_87560/g.244259  ORF Transcript_87560/g.244259 Transcript_87560/m.244259 type:complete len:360 (-) Transcript_87560:18-1097(-)
MRHQHIVKAHAGVVEAVEGRLGPHVLPGDAAGRHVQEEPLGPLVLARRIDEARNDDAPSGRQALRYPHLLRVRARGAKSEALWRPRRGRLHHEAADHARAPLREEEAPGLALLVGRPQRRDLLRAPGREHGAGEQVELDGQADAQAAAQRLGEHAVRSEEVAHAVAEHLVQGQVPAGEQLREALRRDLPRLVLVELRVPAPRPLAVGAAAAAPARPAARRGDLLEPRAELALRLLVAAAAPRAARASLGHLVHAPLLQQLHGAEGGEVERVVLLPARAEAAGAAHQPQQHATRRPHGERERAQQQPACRQEQRRRRRRSEGGADQASVGDDRVVECGKAGSGQRGVHCWARSLSGLRDA